MQETENQSMLKTGLPYDLDLMNKIAEKGAIVDMNDINFPGIPEDKKIRTSFIFLRNTGFENIKLDFTNVPYPCKEQFLLEFITGDIEYSSPELVESWLSILLTFNDIEATEIAGILSKEEITEFIKNNPEIIFKISSLVYSLPVMLLHRMKDQKWDFDIEENTFGEGNIKNISAILNSQDILQLYTQMDDYRYDLVYYSDIFANDQDDLFLSIMKSPIFVIIFGLSTTSIDWNKLINEGADIQ